MVYHLARIPNWIQNHTIAHYPTHIIRQISQPPFAEWIGLHVLILDQKDWFLNLIQWFAFIFSMFSISHITAILGGDKKQQFLSALILATIPMVILQSSSTQNDLIAGMFLLMMMQFLLLIKKDFCILRWHFAFAAASGLLLLTKGTGFIYGFIPGIFYLYLCACQIKGRFKHYVIYAGLIVLILNAGHWIRNYKVFKSPLGPTYGLNNEQISISTFGSNALRNVGLQIQNPFQSINKFSDKAINKIHSVLNWDISNPKSTWQGSFPFKVDKLRHHEDYSSGWMHFLIFLFLSPLIFILPSKKEEKYLWMLIAGTAILFCFILKWQVWHCRLHLPILMLTVPLIALRIKKPTFQYLILSLFLFQALAPLLKNESKALVAEQSVLKQDRFSTYFNNRKDMETTYRSLKKFLLQRNKLENREGDVAPVMPPQDIGLISANASWEYLFWMDGSKLSKRKVNSWEVDNESKKTSNFKSFMNVPIPGLLIVQRPKWRKQESIELGGNLYKKQWEENGIAIFE